MYFFLPYSITLLNYLIPKGVPGGGLYFEDRPKISQWGLVSPIGWDRETVSTT